MFLKKSSYKQLVGAAIAAVVLSAGTVSAQAFCTLLFGAGDNGQIEYPTGDLLAGGLQIVGEQVQNGITYKVGSYLCGHVEFTALPDEGYRVKSWTRDGEVVSDNTTNTYVFSSVLTGGGTVLVEFEVAPIISEPLTVTFNTLGGSEIDPIRVTYGGKITRPEDPTIIGPAIIYFDGWYREYDDCADDGSIAPVCVEEWSGKWDFDVDVVTEDITLYAKWGSTYNSILTADREVPQVEEVTVVAPVNRATLSLTIGPNPANRQAGVVNLYLAGAAVQSGNLTIYDPTGNIVRRLAVDSDVITWDLRDSRGRLVVDGSYLVRGTITTSSNNREHVSAIFGVR